MDRLQVQWALGIALKVENLVIISVYFLKQILSLIRNEPMNRWIWHKATEFLSESRIYPISPQ